MTRWLTILGIVLIVQIAVAVGVNVTRERYRAVAPEEKLLSFNAASVDHIRIDGDDNTHVMLKKQDDQWRLPDLKDFPADQGNVKRLLDRLAALEKGWPVATTTSAAKRFKVTDTAFERKLTLSQGDQTQAALFVGTSPGFRKVHVRLPNEDDIRAVEFNTYEVGVKPDDWIDKAILTHKVDDIQRVELPDVTLQQQDDKLAVVGLAEGEETVTDEAKRLVERIAGLNIRAVLGAEETSGDGAGEPVLQYTLALKSGETHTYTFTKLEKDAGHYLLKTSQRDETFRVDTWTVDQIKKATRDQLIRKPSPAPAAAEPPKESSQSSQ